MLPTTLAPDVAQRSAGRLPQWQASADRREMATTPKAGATPRSAVRPKKGNAERPMLPMTLAAGTAGRKAHLLQQGNADHHALFATPARGAARRSDVLPRSARADRHEQLTTRSACATRRSVARRAQENADRRGPTEMPMVDTSPWNEAHPKKRKIDRHVLLTTLAGAALPERMSADCHELLTMPAAERSTARPQQGSADRRGASHCRRVGALPPKAVQVTLGVAKLEH
mmetsp:Transcript_17460/g.47764  ORF Transcript_17460/g.47764 Transcript_17460/m.47764 type:complete len:229 (-) Transcript_17460:3077-3763(-)